MLDTLEPKDAKEMTELLKKAGSNNKEEAIASRRAIAAALTTPLRQGVLTGDTVSGIFAKDVYEPSQRIEYPVDFYRADNASEYVAFTIPAEGKIPSRRVEGDYVTVPTYDIGAGIDFLARYAKEARWDIVARALEVLEAGFTKKINDDGWHIIMAAGFDRNLVVGDANAAAGQLTKKLISLMKLVMRRNAGGNSTSLNRGKLTHVYLSPEALEDIRNWGIDQVDEITRREIYVAGDGTFNKIFGITLVDLDELGENQEYQDYYANVIAAGAPNDGLASATDVELLIGLDLTKKDSFVMPVREELTIMEDETLKYSRRMGFIATESHGVACLDTRRVLLGSI